jgi:hypothetical protein
LGGGALVKQKVNVFNNLNSNKEIFHNNKELDQHKEFIDIEYNIEVLEPYTRKLFETYTDETYRDINYFRSHRTRHLIVLKCMQYFCGKKELTFEKLIDYIPLKYGSRSHKINCINEMCDRGILQRVENINDKRSTIVQPTFYILKLYSKLNYSYKKILYDFEPV